MKREKEEIIKKNKLLKQEELKLKQEEVREEIKLNKERKIELRKFIREEHYTNNQSDWLKGNPIVNEKN